MRIGNISAPNTQNTQNRQKLGFGIEYRFVGEASRTLRSLGENVESGEHHHIVSLDEHLVKLKETIVNAVRFHHANKDLHTGFLKGTEVSKEGIAHIDVLNITYPGDVPLIHAEAYDVANPKIRGMISTEVAPFPGSLQDSLLTERLRFTQKKALERANKAANCEIDQLTVSQPSLNTKA